MDAVMIGKVNKRLETKKDLFLEAGRAVTGLNSEDIPVMGSCLVK